MDRLQHDRRVWEMCVAIQWRYQKCQLEGLVSLLLLYHFPFRRLSFFLFYPSPFFLPSPFLLPSLPLEVGPPKIQLEGLGSAVTSTSRVWGKTHPKFNLMHFNFKRWDLMATILIIFPRKNWPNWQIECRLNVCLCLVWSIGDLIPVSPPCLRHWLCINNDDVEYKLQKVQLSLE